MTEQRKRAVTLVLFILLLTLVAGYRQSEPLGSFSFQPSGGSGLYLGVKFGPTALHLMVSFSTVAASRD